MAVSNQFVRLNNNNALQRYFINYLFVAANDFFCEGYWGDSADFLNG
jgi:hypothetical protein